MFERLLRWLRAHPAIFYAGLAAIATLVLVRPLGWHAATTSFDDADALQQMWLLRWLQTAWSHGLPVLHAPTNYPYPHSLALYQPLYTAAALGLPLYWLGLTPLAVYNCVVLLSFALAFWGAALLTHALTRQLLAGTLAGLVYAFATVRFAHIMHLNMLSGFWLPLALLAWHHATDATGWRRWSWTAALGLLGAAQLLADIYNAVFFAAALGLLLVGVLLHPSQQRRQRLNPLLLGGGLALLLALPLALPLRQAQQELGLQRSWDDHVRFAASMQQYLVRDTPGPLGLLDGSSPAASFNVEDWRWPGLLPLLLLPFGWRVRRGWFLYALTLAGLALLWSLGPTLRLTRAQAGLPNPFYAWTFAHVPLFAAVRVPTRWAMLLQCALSVLAGLGVAGLRLHLRGRWLASLATAGLLALALLDSWHAPLKQLPDRVALQPLPAVYPFLATLPPGPLLEFPLQNADSRLANRQVYYQLAHSLPLVNGANSIEPPAYLRLKQALRDFPSASSVALLADLGVRYVNVSRWEVGNWPALSEQLAASPYLKLLGSFESERNLVYAVTARPPSTPLRAGIVAAPGGALLVTEATTPIWLAPPATLYTATLVPLEIDLPTTPLQLSSPLGAVLLPGAQALPLPALSSALPPTRITLGTTVAELLPPPPAAVPLGAAAAQLAVAPLPATVQPGARLPCLAYGRGQQLSAGLVLGATLIDQSWNVLARHDYLFEDQFPAPEHWASTAWTPAPCSLDVPGNLPPGDYFLTLGLFDPALGDFRPFIQPDGTETQIWRSAQPIHVAP